MLDPEDALVDWKNVEADLSGEIDTKDLVDFSSAAEDKVLVSIRSVICFDHSCYVFKH
jgi:hypothetical protein